MRAFALAALFLIGCNGDALAIDEDFTDGEVELIHEAIREWMDATDSESSWIGTLEGLDTPGRFSYWDDWTDGPDFPSLYKIRSDDPGYNELKFFVGGDPIGGAALQGWRIALVVDRLEDSPEYTYDEVFYSVLLHELGHFHGLGHAEEGVMKSTTSGKQQCIDWLTLADFCSLHQNCGSRKHSTCE